MNIWRKVSTVIVLSFVAAASISAQGKLNAQEIIDKHLLSIASAERRAAMASLIAVGEVQVENVAKKSQTTQGRIVIASEGPKIFVGMRLNSPDYPEEKFVFDGSKSFVATTMGSRSQLGNFVEANGAVLTSSILAGGLSTSWALLSSADGRYKVLSVGSKKIDGKEVYAVNFIPKNGSDLDITMFFDKESFQHVRTEYKRTISANIGRTVELSIRESETRLKVIEDFSDFKQHQGISLPGTYSIDYTVIGQSGTFQTRWNFKFSEFAVNPRLEKGTFDIK